MDISKIKRRERRFYRTEVNGEIVYTDSPIKESTAKGVIVTRLEKEESKKIPEKTRKTIEENTKLTSQEKKQIIDKILSDLRNRINPDIDEISEMIYSQLSVKDVNVTQESVKQIVQNNAHHRSSRNGAVLSTGAQGKDKTESFDYLNDRKELECVIDDIVEENKKEDIREKTKKEKEKKEAEKLTKEKKTEKESPKNRRNAEAKKEEPKKEKPKPEPEKKKPKEEFKLDFGDDDDLDNSKDSEGDELGLKF